MDIERLMSSSCLRSFRSLNQNVQIGLLYVGCSSFATGIWGYAVLSGYLKVLTGSNTMVGIAEGIQGTCQVIAAFPAGWLADTYNRDQVLQYASFIGQIAVVAIVLALFSDDLASLFSTEQLEDKEELDLDEQAMKFQFVLLCVGLGLWGTFVGSSAAAFEALFADSTTDEDRPRMNQYKLSTRLAAASSGPLSAILLFYFIGDSWTRIELRAVFVTGVTFLLPSLLLLYNLKDSFSLVDAETMSTEDTTSASRLSETNTHEGPRRRGEANNPLLDPLLSGEDASVEVKESSEESSTYGEGYDTSAHYWVPRILVAADLFAGFASGMTIKFFPLFFKEESLMSPIEVSFVLLSAYLMISLFSYFARLSAGHIGRVKTLLVFQLAGVSLLMSMYVMGIGYDIKAPGQVPLWRNKFVIVPVYLVRTALMNSVSPIERAILMEYVPSHQRGVWNAFESLTQFGWSGSAVLGGYLVDTYGYGVTFLATALIQLMYALTNGALILFIS